MSGVITTYLSFSTDKIVILAKLGDSIFKNCVKFPELTEAAILVVNDEYSCSGVFDPVTGIVICSDTRRLYPWILKKIRRRLDCKIDPIYFINDMLIFIELEVATIIAF